MTRTVAAVGVENTSFGVPIEYYKQMKPLMVTNIDTANVDGRHFRDPYLERASVDERPLLYKSAARAAATLHGARRRPIAASTASAMARGTSSAMWPGQQRCRRSSRINGLPASGL